jgi:hypothetical protein
MAIETTFERLERALEKLKTELEELRVNATDFFPVPRTPGRKNGQDPDETPPPPVVMLADTAADLEGEVEQGHQASREACQAVRHPRNLAHAQVALATVQLALNRLLRKLVLELATYDALQTLVQMARQRGKAWADWASLVKSLVNLCEQRALDAAEALADCWQDLTDKLAVNSVSVQATNIGQQITAREPLTATAQEFT